MGTAGRRKSHLCSSRRTHQNTKMSDFANGKKMKYPYSTFGMMQALPYRFMWKNSRLLRTLAFSFGVTFPVILGIQIVTHTAGNVALWQENRKAYDVDKFAPLDHRKDC